MRQKTSCTTVFFTAGCNEVVHHTVRRLVKFKILLKLRLAMHSVAVDVLECGWICEGQLIGGNSDHFAIFLVQSQHLK